MWPPPVSRRQFGKGCGQEPLGLTWSERPRSGWERKRERALLQEEERLRNKLEVRRMIFTEIIASKASLLVSSMAQIFAIYIYTRTKNI